MSVCGRYVPQPIQNAAKKNAFATDDKSDRRPKRDAQSGSSSQLNNGHERKQQERQERVDLELRKAKEQARKQDKVVKNHQDKVDKLHQQLQLAACSIDDMETEDDGEQSDLSPEQLRAEALAVVKKCRTDASM